MHTLITHRPIQPRKSQFTNLISPFLFLPLSILSSPTFVPSAASLSLFFSYLPSSFFFSLSFFSRHPSLPSWYSLLVKYLGGMLGAGRPKEDQQRKGCSCCGLAACFIIIPLPACLGFGVHRASCKVRIHDFLKNVWVTQVMLSFSFTRIITACNGRASLWMNIQLPLWFILH